MEHLTPEAAGWLNKPVNERIAALTREKWIGHTQAQRILVHLGQMHHGPLVDKDAKNLLIIGEPGSGKTSVMRHYAKANPPSSQGHPLLLLELANGPKESALYEAMLKALHSSYPPRASTEDRRFQLFNVLKANNVQMIFIDEIHHILVGSAMQQRSFLVGLKSLLNGLPIPIVCAGRG